MPFNPNIPQPTDRLAKSQQDLLSNNLQLNTSFGVNHYPFSDLTSFNGMHAQCQFVEQVSAPVPIAQTNTLYSIQSTPGELFYKRFAGNPIQMTGPFEPVQGGKGYTFLPGGMLLQWGFINSTASSYTPLLFVTNNIDFPSKCIFISTQPYSGATVPNSQATISILDSSVSNTGFQWAFITNSAQYTGFYWSALGF